jgi:hypothetical protein
MKRQTTAQRQRERKEWTARRTIGRLNIQKKHKLERMLERMNELDFAAKNPTPKLMKGRNVNRKQHKSVA